MAQADDIGIEILGWLAREPEMLGRFLALSGLEASGLRQAVREPGFFAGLLAFLMNHEPSLMTFCGASGIRPEEVARAFRELGGVEGFSS